MNDWNQNYEKLTDMIVPRSSQMIFTDQDYALYTVTLFKKVVAEFKHHARERKYVLIHLNIFQIVFNRNKTFFFTSSDLSLENFRIMKKN